MFEAANLLAALEYAKFDDPEIRIKLTNVLKALEEDLNEVGYEPGPNTKVQLESLEEYFNDLNEDTEDEDDDEDETTVEEDIDDFIVEIDRDDDDEDEKA